MIALFFSLTLLVSSALVFLVQLMCAKMVLPYLGGTPGVWNTCMVFFQAGLLLGYAYAHVGPQWLGVRRHAFLHLVLLGLAFCLLPINLRPEGAPPPEPVFWLLGLLSLGLGLPFVLVASSGPLVQRWFACRPQGKNPYFLYAASNLGSMLGLFSYPFLIEPYFTLDEQNYFWTWSFAFLVLLLAGCAPWKGEQREVSGEPTSMASSASRPSFGQCCHWVLLALVPSSLLLSVTSYLTTDIAAIPLLWVVPMSLYLFSFVLVFSGRFFFLQAIMARWLPGMVLFVLMILLAEGTEPIGLILMVHLVGFFWVAMVCHGQLARSKPAVEHLTEFYLWLAVGGVAGGLFNALLAPLVFPSLVEYPLMLVLACWLNPREKDVRANLPSPLALPQNLGDLLVPVLIGLVTLGLVLLVPTYVPTLIKNRHFPIDFAHSQGLSVALMFCLPGFLCLLAAERPVRFSLSLAGLLLASVWYDGVQGKPVYRERSFFGVHRVTETNGFRNLVHGNTVHGMQSLDPQNRRLPLTYYFPTGPMGQVFTLLQGDPRLERVGLVGLGTGALASYACPGQAWTFFEIDPAVERIAQDPALFTFLKDSSGTIDVALGDARLTLEQTQDKFGVLVIDAFGSDSIPLHLLTREALQVYRRHLRPGGLLVFHISNRYLHLEPVLANLAHEAGWLCFINQDPVGEGTREKKLGKYPSIWVLLAEKREDLAFLGKTTRWLRAQPAPHQRPWTDDFSNIFQVLRLTSEEK